MTAAERVDVEVTGVGVTYDELTVLDNVSLTFHAGTVTAVMGPSGSGKTTLLTVMAGVQRASCGTVRFSGGLGSGGSGGSGGAAATRIGLVHQAFALLSLLTAAENVELAAQLTPMPRREIRPAAAARLADVNLAGRADHLVEELSGGEQQRVALARALVTAPRVLLADEPTAQLDPASRTVVLDLLRAAADDGVTVVIATHDPDVAATCDRVVTLTAGRVVSTPEQPGLSVPPKAFGSSWSSVAHTGRHRIPEADDSAHHPDR